MQNKLKTLMAIGFAEGICDSLYAQNKREPIEQEVLAQALKIKSAAQKAFYNQPYATRIEGKDLQRIAKKLKEMEEKTFIKGQHDLVASISLNIAMLEEISQKMTGMRRKTVDNIIAELLALQEMYDPEFTEVELYDEAGKAVNVWRE